MIHPRLQIGLRKFLLALAACASWSAYWGNENQRSVANAKLIQMLKNNRSLDVQDTSIVAAQIKSFAGREGSYGLGSAHCGAYYSLDCFVPESGWELCIATRNFQDVGYPSPVQSTPIRKGTSEIELTVEATAASAEIKVRVEGKPTFDLREDKTWMNAQSLEPKGLLPAQQVAAPNTFSLARLQFSETRRSAKNLGDQSAFDSPPQEYNGVLLWLRKSQSDKTMTKP